MAPILDWKKLMKVDPDALPHQEDLADRLLETVSKVDGKDLKTETPDKLIHLFKITQSLMKMKAQEVELALEEVEKAGEEQAKCENQFNTKVMKLQQELEMSQRSAGGRDTRFLRDEIRRLEKQLEHKERQLTDREKELEKEKKANEQLALRNEDAEKENIKLRREKKRIKKKNEQLHQDVVDYQKEIDSQKDTILLEREDHRSKLSKKNSELVQYLDEIQNLTEAYEKLDIQNQEMRKNLEEAVPEVEKMTAEYNKMKLIVQQSDSVMDQLRKENEQYRFQVQDLSDQLKAKTEEDDPLMAAVDAKVEEWKKILASKDDELLEYQQMLINLKEKMKMAQLDVDRNNILALQQAVQEKDAQIRLLTEQVEQYTKEMEQNAFIFEELKTDLQKDKGHSSLAQQNRIADMEEKLKMLEERTKEAEKWAELAEADAREKDKELVEALKRMRDYEQGIYGLEEAVAEITDLKKQIKIRDHEIETLIKEGNKLELKINDFLDENEELRERLGLDPKTMIDLNEFRNSKALKQQQYRAENQILLQEIERLEEERIELKKQIRKLAQEKGRRGATIELDAGDVRITDSFTEEKEMHKRKFDFLNRSATAEVKAKNEYLANELSVRERELEENRTVIAKFQSKLKELSEENKQLEQGMKEILQAVKEMQKYPSVNEGETALTIPSLDRLVNLELALRKIQEHVRTILETGATCKSLEEKLKEKEAALWKAEQNVLSRDKEINELRLRLAATSEREKIMAELGEQEEDPEYHHAIKIAQQAIANMQARLNLKEEVIKKYQRLLAKASEEQEEMAKKHEEDLRVLYQKLHLLTDNSLDKLKQTSSELMKKISSSLSDNRHFLRLAELEQTVAEQERFIASLVGKLKEKSDLEKQKQITLMKIKEFETLRAQLQENHTVDVGRLKDEINELRNVLSQTEKELANVKAELEVQKQANTAPPARLKYLVEELERRLAIKEKQQKDQVGALKETCELLKKEKAELERKLGSIRGAGRSGKTVPELEKIIGLMKKVVDRVQRENEDLKKTPAVVSTEKLLALEQENERLKSEMEKMKLRLEGQLSMRYESNTKGMEEVIRENERLRKELKKSQEDMEMTRKQNDTHSREREKASSSNYKKDLKGKKRQQCFKSHKNGN